MFFSFFFPLPFCCATDLLNATFPNDCTKGLEQQILRLAGQKNELNIRNLIELVLKEFLKASIVHIVFC